MLGMRNPRTKKHFMDLKRARWDEKHNRNRNNSTDAPRIPTRPNPPNVRAFLQDYVPSTESFYGVTYSGNPKVLVYKGHVRANVKFHEALQKGKKM